MNHDCCHYQLPTTNIISLNHCYSIAKCKYIQVQQMPNGLSKWKIGMFDFAIAVYVYQCAIECELFIAIHTLVCARSNTIKYSIKSIL